jgi:lipid-A-disaccharide synthase
MVDSADARLLIVAGEASGDAHAARLVRALTACTPVEVRGVAGPALRAAGVETLVDMSDLSVIGFSAVVRRLPTIWRAMRRLEQEALGWRPHAALLVDSPGFNFRIGPWLERHGVPVFYYIAPQVWAWHPERAREMAGWVKRLAVVFPFEESLFRDAGVPATFVGHPLLESLEPERDASALRAELGVASDARILGILPGSRRQELRAHVPVLLEAAARLARDRRDLVTVLPLAPGSRSMRWRICRARGS